MTTAVHIRAARHPLTHALWLCLALPAALQAQESPQQDPHRQDVHQLDSVVVTASPLHQTAEELVRPVEVLAGEKLDEAKTNTLGQTLERSPGIQSSSFGPGVGRPIIRGLDGARVQVVNDGMGSGDVSTLSADHAVSIEPFLADRIEVMKGPATLLYGSGAIGGAVNVIDGRTPDALPETPFGGRMELRAGTNGHERTGMFRVDGSTETSGSGWVFHADGLLRDSGDIDIPGYAESDARLAAEGETPDPATRGILPNSALRTASGALGVAWVGERGHLGVTGSLFETSYGVPGHAHDGDAHGHDDVDAGEDEEAGGVRIGLDQRRHTLHGGLNDIGIFKTLRFKYVQTDYTHTEYEGGAVGTVFDNRTDEVRLELVHRDVAGWQGAFGLQGGKRDFDAQGEEAFVPPTRGRDLGLFWIGQREFGPVQLELGARLDRNRIESDPLAELPNRTTRRDFDTHNFSGGLRWNIDDQLHLKLGLDRSQRAPSPEELYSNGLHVATSNIEIGDDRLSPETAQRGELGIGWRNDRIRFEASAWITRYADYIHLSPLLEAEDDGHLQAIAVEGTPIQVWNQGDARFHGFEVEGEFTLFDGDRGHLDVRLFGDSVRGKLTGSGLQARDVGVLHDGHLDPYQGVLAGGGNLPRMSPDRIGSELRWEAGDWRASLGAIRTLKQSRTALGETVTPGYTLVDAHFAWHGDTGAGNGWEVFLDGHNLLNEEARPHTSFLKDLAPLPGRGFVGGIRLFF